MPQDWTDPDQPTTKNISAHGAQQGRNVKGMIWVLIASIVLAIAAYVAMLVRHFDSVTLGHQAVEHMAPTAGPGGPAPMVPGSSPSPPQ